MSGQSNDLTIDGELQQLADRLRAGPDPQALDRLAVLLQQHPDHPGVLRLQGICLAQMGKADQAEPCLARAAQLQPGSAIAASDHASVLLSLSRFEAALAILLAAEQHLDERAEPRDQATFWFNLGRAFKQTGQAQDAVKPLLAALELQPQHYAALIVLGDVYKALGQAREAAACYRRAIDLDATDGTAWWSLSNLKSGEKSGSFSDEEFARLQQQSKGRKPLRQQMMFEFALASGWDQRREIDLAFSHYRSGNQLARQREPWDRTQFRSWLRSLQDKAGNLPLSPDPALSHQPRPIFIVSLPRSGSTLVEQVLAAHSQVTAASELPWIPQLIAEESSRQGTGLSQWITNLQPGDWLGLGQQYLQKCRHWTHSTPVFTDKLPGNLPYIAAILAMLPQALVIGVRREAMDVCWSCYRQLQMGGSAFLYDFPSLAGYWQDFESHMDFWEQQLPRRVMSIQYESLVAEPESVTRQLLEFAGLAFEEACLNPQNAQRAVNTASALQVREAIHKRGLGHWRAYAHQLGELQEALQSQGK